MPPKTPPPSVGSLSAALEAALLRQLAATWSWENEIRFGRTMRPPQLRLTDSAARLGRWMPAARMIELSRTLVMDHRWGEVVGVFLHEMAHQYTDEVLHILGETAHGTAFRAVCLERGIDSRAVGAPPVDRQAEARADKTLERVRKLLALAGSAHQQEAELAMRRAHELMLRHNLDRTLLSTAPGEGAWEVRTLGGVGTRRNRVERDVVSILQEFFFVRVILVPEYVATVGRTAWVYEISGTHHNVEMAAHVWSFLLGTAGRLWEKNRDDVRILSGRDRLRYQSGVITGFGEKLREERQGLQQQGLVWVGDKGLDTFYGKRYPGRVSRRTTSSQGMAHTAGREAGRAVVLHKPVGAGPSGAEPRRLGSP